MDTTFWLKRWHEGQIGFHQPQGHPALADDWPTLDLAADARVLVPLCGKSRDMAWLAARGHRVTGVELSEQAARAFFAESGVEPEVTTDTDCTRYTGGGVQILVGDFFALAGHRLAGFDAVYDRAALIALPASMRNDYVAALAAATGEHAVGLLVAVDYPPDAMDGPPFSIPTATVHQLFDPEWQVEPLAEGETRIGAAQTPAHETRYRLRRRPALR